MARIQSALRPGYSPLRLCREAEFSELECRLSSAQVTAYDAAAQLWRDLRSALVIAVAGKAVQGVTAVRADRHGSTFGCLLGQMAGARAPQAVRLPVCLLERLAAAIRLLLIMSA